MKIFDVVELKNGDKANIVAKVDKGFKAAIFDNKGNEKGYSIITDADVDKPIYIK